MMMMTSLMSRKQYKMYNNVRCIGWCHFQWLWMTDRHTISRCWTSQKRYKMDTSKKLPTLAWSLPSSNLFFKNVRYCLYRTHHTCNFWTLRFVLGYTPKKRNLPLLTKAQPIKRCLSSLVTRTVRSMAKICDSTCQHCISIDLGYVNIR